MKNIADPRDEHELLVEIGYRCLKKQDLRNSYHPIFLMHHRTEKTLSYVQVMEYGYNGNDITYITVKYADGSFEKLDSTKLENRLFIRV